MPIEVLEQRRLLTSVTASSFDPDLAGDHQFRFWFDVNVGASLSGADMSVHNLSAGYTSTPSIWGWTASEKKLRYVPSERSSVAPRYLRDGNYEVILSGAGIADASGNTLGDDFVFGNFFYNADFDRDRDVDNHDESILLDNMDGMVFGLPGGGGGSSSKKFTQGDATGDGVVDWDDWDVLQARFGTRLMEPPTAVNYLSSQALYVEPPPEGWSVIPPPGHHVRLEWTAPDWVFEGFRIYRSDDGFNFSLIHEGLTNTFEASGMTVGGAPPIFNWLDEGLEDGTKHWYRIRSYTAAEGNSHTTNKVSAVTVLASPTNVSALEGTEPGTVHLTWTPNSENQTAFRVEYSIDGGATWIHAGNAPANGSSMEISGLGQPAVHQFRVRAENPAQISAWTLPAEFSGWAVPVVVVPAAAAPSLITQDFADLSVLGGLAGGSASSLTYTWSVASAPAGGYASFSDNGTNGAKQTQATFTSAGTYRLLATIAYGASRVNSSVDVTVEQTLTSIKVTPPLRSVDSGDSVQLAASALDQFGHAMVSQPSFSWDVASGAGSVTASGSYTASSDEAGWATVEASAGSISGSGDLLVLPDAIDFQDLSSQTVVTTQYPGVTFSAGQGAIVKVLATGFDLHNGSYNHFIHTAGPLYNGWTQATHDVYVDFATPVSDLAFSVTADNEVGVVAELRIFEDGVLAGTEPLYGSGSVYTRDPHTFYDYENITRIEIVNVTDWSGLGYDDFSFSRDGVDIIPHRTGNNIGVEVVEAVEDEADPAKFLVLTNNDFEQGLSEGRRDYDDETAAIPTGSTSDDDDLAKITLRQLSPGMSEGTLEVMLSDPDAVRLFKSDGSILNPSELTLDLTSPSGYLAGLTSGDVDVWVEALEPDSHFVFAVTYSDAAGQPAAYDDAHMTLAEWRFTGVGGREIAEAQPIWKEGLLGATSHPAVTSDGAMAGASFKSRIDGLSDDFTAQLQVTSDYDPSDSFPDNLLHVGGGVESEQFAVLYSADQVYSANADTPVTTAERDLIRQVLNLNVVHNPGQRSELTSGPAGDPTDIHHRNLQARRAVGLTITDDVVKVGDRIQGTATVPPGTGGAAATRLIVRTDDGQWVQSAVGATSLAFDFAANAARDVTVTATAEHRDLVWTGAHEFYDTKYAYLGSGMVRVLQQGATMPVWHQQAWEALRVSGVVPAHPINRNRRISELYAEKFNSGDFDNTPNPYEWFGLAAFASKAAGDGMATAQSWGLLGQWPRDLLNALGEGNLAIYMDMYPQALAYGAENLGGIQGMRQRGEIAPAQLLAWQNIDAGKSTFNNQQVWTGTDQLVNVEQRQTLQRVLNKNLPLWESATNFAPGFAPIVSPFPGVNSNFQAYRTLENIDGDDVPDNASFANANARMAWFTEVLLPGWRDGWRFQHDTIDVNLLLNGGYG